MNNLRNKVMLALAAFALVAVSSSLASAGASAKQNVDLSGQEKQFEDYCRSSYGNDLYKQMDCTCLASKYYGIVRQELLNEQVANAAKSEHCGTGSGRPPRLPPRVPLACFHDEAEKQNYRPRFDVVASRMASKKYLEACTDVEGLAEMLYPQGSCSVADCGCERAEFTKMFRTTRLNFYAGASALVHFKSKVLVRCAR